VSFGLSLRAHIVPNTRERERIKEEGETRQRGGKTFITSHHFISHLIIQGNSRRREKTRR
jgi:hypothetical protein